MSIFKESFPKYIQNQLIKRGEIVEEGSRSENFFTYTTSKQCTLRLSSGVDIEDQTLVDGEVDPKNWVLEGGIKDASGKNRGGLTESTTSNPTGTQYAYGDTVLNANAKDGFGIVPMPGITNAQVSTKTAYGSLRTAKVSFECHNQRQLEVLELLYMRPGYTLLLEWQWSPFINNNGVKDNTIFDIDEFWDNQSSTSEIERKIIDNKEKSGGNYDAVVGYCKNFSYKLRPDGGFNCETEIIAKGEIIESLKTPEILYNRTGDGTPGLIKSHHPLEIWIDKILQYSDDVDQNNDTTNINDKIDDKQRKSLEDALKLAMGTDKVYPNILPKNITLSNSTTTQDLTDETMGEDKEDNTEGITDGADYYFNTYVRWDCFAQIMNNTCIPKDAKDNNIFEIQTCDITRKYGGTQIEPLLYTKITDQGMSTKIQTIDNPGSSVWWSTNSKTKRTLAWTLIDQSLDPGVMLLPHFTRNEGSNGAMKTVYADNFQAHPSHVSMLEKSTGATLSAKGNVGKETEKYNIGSIFHLKLKINK